jgi:PAS domain S-box-containing protein
MLDSDGYIVSWNRGAERIKGYTAEEIIGKHFSIFYPKEDVETGKPRRVLDKARSEGHVEDESWRVRKDGTRFWANVVVTCLRDPDGTVRGFTKVTRDLTERKRQQDAMLEMRSRESAQLREHARKLEDLEKAKGRLLNLASHELRGPLAVLRGYISMIADGSVKPEQVASLSPILLAKANQINTLVQQMLESARLEDSRLQLSKKKINLTQLVHEAVDDLSPLLPEGQQIVIDGPASVEANVDGERVRTIITNLLDNAIKYSLGRGDIVCSLEQRDGRARISVLDHGPGISTTDMNRLFGRFERIITDENNHVPGTGLGLHLARELARLHGGELSASSTVGKGSEFVLSLPL